MTSVYNLLDLLHDAVFLHTLLIVNVKSCVLEVLGQEVLMCPPSALKRISLQDFPASITFRERLLMSFQVLIKGKFRKAQTRSLVSAFLAKPRLVLQAKHIARQAFISCYWLHAIPPACHAEQEIFLETLLRNALENCCKHFERVRKHGCSTMVPKIHSSITRQSTKGQPALKSLIQPQ